MVECKDGNTGSCIGQYPQSEGYMHRASRSEVMTGEHYACLQRLCENPTLKGESRAQVGCRSARK